MITFLSRSAIFLDRSKYLLDAGAKSFQSPKNVILSWNYFIVHYQAKRNFVIISKPKRNGFELDPFKIQDPDLDFT